MKETLSPLRSNDLLGAASQEKEVYTVEEIEPGLFQSVFPSASAEFSQLHTSKEDAVGYIHEVAGAVEIE